MIETVTVPEGQRGPWTVRRFTVSAQGAEWTAMRAAMKGERHYVPAGTYTQLVHSRRGIVMSDTPAELRDHRFFVRAARGHVLINGLGLGAVLLAILRKPEVMAVTVVEIDADVIALVAPHYTDSRLTIVNADAFEYQPPKGVRYGAAWHDIWDAICGDNLEGMSKLKRKYGRRADWQGCWCEDECRRANRGRS